MSGQLCPPGTNAWETSRADLGPEGPPAGDWEGTGGRTAADPRRTPIPRPAPIGRTCPAAHAGGCLASRSSRGSPEARTVRRSGACRLRFRACSAPPQGRRGTRLSKATAPQCTAGKPGAPAPYKGRGGGLQGEWQRRSAVEGQGKGGSWGSLRGGALREGVEEAGRRGKEPRL